MQFWLKVRMDELGLTPTQLGRRAGIPQTTILYWLKQERVPIILSDVDKLYSLSKALNYPRLEDMLQDAIPSLSFTNLDSKKLDNSSLQMIELMQPLDELQRLLILTAMKAIVDALTKEHHIPPNPDDEL